MRIHIATLHVRASAQAVPLAAACLKAGLPTAIQQTTRLIDLFPQQNDDTIIERLLDGNPELIAFPLYLWNRQRVLALCCRIKKTDPDIFLLAGGPEASADAQSVLRQGQLDAVIRGEGDQSFAALVAWLSNKQTTTARAENAELPSIPGLLLPKRHELPPAAVCAQIEELASPWLDGLLPLEPGAGLLWEVARGCHFNCAFCYDAKGHRGVRPLPLERLQRELQLFRDAQIGQIWVLDSTFNSPPQRGKQLLRMLLEIAPEIHYHIEAKIDLLDSETIELLGQLSCSLQVGLQTADNAVLNPLHRHLERSQMSASLQQLSALGVTFGLDLIYGLPGDNHAGFCDSLDFALRQQPNQLDIFPLAVLPGTELYQKQTEFGISGAPEPPYLLLSSRSYPPEQLEQSRLLAAACDIFYNRGRAVGFFLQLTQALKMTPSQLLQRFADWLENRCDFSRDSILDDEQWQPQQILQQQIDFTREQLTEQKRKRLARAATDLINYHHCCAETLLAEDCLAPETLANKKALRHSRWQLNPAVILQHFNYPLAGLEQLGGETLEVMARELPPEEEEVIFLRQNGTPLSEPLDEGFARLLRRAEKVQTGDQLMDGYPSKEGVEFLSFAVAQGLLLEKRGNF